MKHYFARISHIFFILTSLLLLNGCVNTRFLAENEDLFQKNKVEINSDSKVGKEKQLKKDIASISQLQPNKKFLGLTKSSLWFYNVASKKRETKFRFWLKNNIGEVPVLYDEALVEKSIKLMENYLINRGYFYANVDYETEIKKKKAIVTYKVNLGSVYRLDSIFFPEQNTRFDYIIQENKKNSLLISGEPFDVNILKNERQRISDDLRNRGYYMINREFVYFDLDSSEVDKKINVHMHVNPLSDTSEHQVYYMDQVYLYTDYSFNEKGSRIELDTLIEEQYHFISEDLKYKTEVLKRAIHFRYNDIYRKRDYQRTLRSLSNFGVFKFINIKFKTKQKEGKNYIDTYIYLSQSKKQQVGLEFKASNSSDYLLGVATTLSYLNRNIFKSAELLELSTSLGVESNLGKDVTFFNTVDFSTAASIRFNKFIIPFKLKNLAKNSDPVTRVSAKYNYLRRINYYTINITSLSFGYSWRSKATSKHVFNPIVASLVRVKEASDEFLEMIEKSPTLRNSFTEQLLLGPEYIYLWTNSATHKRYYFFFFRGRINMAGNLLNGIMTLVNLNKNEEKPYKVFKIEYAQFFKIDGDVRNYYEFNKKAKLVSRMFAGVGVPYGNSTALTYIKQFYSGGAYGIRAWRVKTLGPGSFNFDESEFADGSNFVFDQTGEIKLEGNIELRFDIFKFLKGAVFFDTGNIWTLESDTSRPGSNFEFNRFYKEFAIGAGIGFRIDFSYFVLRFDMATPIRDPSNPDDPWVVDRFGFSKKKRKESLKFILAIGYPF